MEKCCFSLFVALAAVSALFGPGCDSITSAADGGLDGMVIPDVGLDGSAPLDGGPCGHIGEYCCVSGTTPFCHEGTCYKGTGRCVAEGDGGVADSGVKDGGSPDAGEKDAEVDAGIYDGGSFDSGATDAGADSGFDSGYDAGTDAGPGDGGPQPDGGATDGGVIDGGNADGGGGETDAGTVDGGVTPDAGTPCGAQDMECCKEIPECDKDLYCIGAYCKALPYCIPSPTGLGGDMCHVPGSSFKMGCDTSVDKECYANEVPMHLLDMSPFLIDMFEVTVNDYTACVKDEVCKTPPTGAGPVWECNYYIAGRENHPMNCVNWGDALAFCKWAGKWLPTEAQWEMAARGTDSYVWPWGFSPAADCNLAIMYDGPTPGCGTSSTWEVGSKKDGRSPYGALDIAGNVWEWVADWFDYSYYTYSPSKDPTGPEVGIYKGVRGGAWNCGPTDLRTTMRNHADPVTYGPVFGFRCVAVPDAVVK